MLLIGERLNDDEEVVPIDHFMRGAVILILRRVRDPLRPTRDPREPRIRISQGLPGSLPRQTPLDPDPELLRGREGPWRGVGAARVPSGALIGSNPVSILTIMTPWRRSRPLPPGALKTPQGP